MTDVVKTEVSDSKKGPDFEPDIGDHLMVRRSDNTWRI